MKKIGVLCLLLLSIPLFAQTTITKNIGDFTTLKVFNGIEVELIKSEVQKLEITGEKAEKVKVKNVNNILKLSLKFPELSADGKVVIKLFYNGKINTIDGNEGATITGKNITQDQLEVKAQERAFINLVATVKHLRVKSSSGGIIKMTGSAKNQDVDLDLYGIYHGFGFKVANNSTVKSGTGAKAEVFAEETLHAKVSFGGSILYKGNPKVVKDKKVIGGIIEAKN